MYLFQPITRLALPLVLLLTTINATACGEQVTLKCVPDTECTGAGWRQISREVRHYECPYDRVFLMVCERVCAPPTPYPTYRTCNAGDCDAPNWEFNGQHKRCDGNCHNSLTCCNERCNDGHCTVSPWVLADVAPLCAGGCPSNSLTCCKKDFGVCENRHCTGDPFVTKTGYQNIRCPDDSDCPINTDYCCTITDCEAITITDFEITDKYEGARTQNFADESISGHNCGDSFPLALNTVTTTTEFTVTISEEMSWGKSLNNAFGFAETKERTITDEVKLTVAVGADIEIYSTEASLEAGRTWSDTTALTNEHSFSVESDKSTVKVTSTEKKNTVEINGIDTEVPGYAWREYTISYWSKPIHVIFDAELTCVNDGGKKNTTTTIHGNEIVTGVAESFELSPTDRTAECNQNGKSKGKFPAYDECTCFGIGSDQNPSTGCQAHQKYGAVDGLLGCYVYKGVPNCNNGKDLSIGSPDNYRNNLELTVDYPVDPAMFAWSYRACNAEAPLQASDDRLSAATECDDWIDYNTNKCPSNLVFHPGKSCRGLCNALQCCGKGFEAKINFQPENMAVPPNYLKDSGLTYGSREKATFEYGWNTQAVAHDRFKMGKRDSSLVVVPANGKWEMELVGGVYDVEIGFSDPENGVSIEGCLVQDTEISTQSCQVAPTQVYSVHQTIGIGEKLTISTKDGKCSSLSFVHVTANTPRNRISKFVGEGVCSNYNGQELSPTPVENIQTIGQCRLACSKKGDFCCGILWRPLHNEDWPMCNHYLRQNSSGRRRTSADYRITGVISSSTGETCERMVAGLLDEAVFDLNAEDQDSSSTEMVDISGGLRFQLLGGALVNDGTDRAHFDLTNGPLEKTAGTRIESESYTHAYVLKWRDSDAGWRTLLRHSLDHCAIVQDRTKNLGFYSNRDGHFRDSNYDILTEDRWEVLVVTGESTNGAVGTSTFWAHDQYGGMVPVGTSDRVCSGMEYFRVGWQGQSPGKVARVLAWDRVLSAKEISEVHVSLQPDDVSVVHHVQACDQCGRSWCTDSVGVPSAEFAENYVVSDSLAKWGCENVKPWMAIVRDVGTGGVFVVEADIMQLQAGVVFDLNADDQDSTGIYKDSANNLGFELLGGAYVTDGPDRAHWDLANGPLQRTQGALTESNAYTHAYVLKWRESDAGWRTLLRHSLDHCAIVEHLTKNLGIYSNRNGYFRDSEYDITPTQDRWEVLVVTGESTDGAIGTSTFWAEDPAGGLKSVGTSDRVCSGMDYYRIGWQGQSPGKVARVMAWNRVLSAQEISEVYSALQPGRRRFESQKSFEFTRFVAASDLQ